MLYPLLAIGAGWLPCGRPGEGLTGKLEGVLDEAAGTLARLDRTDALGEILLVEQRPAVGIRVRG